MLEPAYHVNQKYPDIDRYGQTRFASNEHFVKLVPEISAQLPDSSNVLVLGCHSGRNDLLPLIDCLILDGKKCCHLDAIEESDSILSLQSELRGRQFIEKEKCWIRGNLTVRLFQNDIEGNIALADGRYDAVLAFFVLNHLTNWPLSIKRIHEVLRKGGSLYVTEYNHPLIRALEEISSPAHKAEIFRWIFDQYHNKRRSEYGVCYANTLLGTDVAALTGFLAGVYEHPIPIVVDYDDRSSKANIKEKIGFDSLHVPVFWGQKIRLGPEGETEDSKYEAFVKGLMDEIEALKADSIDYQAQLKLHRYTKSGQELDWGKLYSLHFQSIFDKIHFLLNPNLSETDLSEGKSLVKRDNQLRIVLQLLLGHQAFTRQTKFCTPLFWPLDFGREPPRLDLTKQASILSIISSRDFEDNLSQYNRHLALFLSSKPRLVISDIIFSDSECDVNWVFQITKNTFSCEFIDNGATSYIVFNIPEKYINISPPHMPGIRDIEGFRLHNFILLSPKADEQVDKQNIFDETQIEADENVRIKEITNVLTTSHWVHLGSNKQQELAIKIAGIIPYFAYLARLGSCVYITNKLFEETINLPKENSQVSLGKRSLGNGGFFLCESGLKVEDLKCKETPLSARFKFLKDSVNLVTQKIVLPDFFTQVRTSEQRLLSHARRAAVAQVMARNMSHNIGSHVLVKLSMPGEIKNLEQVPQRPVTSSNPDNGQTQLLDITELEDVSEFPQVPKDQDLEHSEPVNQNDHWKNFQIANFNSYLKSRMDYLADLATSTPTLQNNAYLARQVLSVFARNKPLVNHISGIGDFKYSIVVEDERDTTNSKRVNLFGKKGGTNEEIEKHDILVAFPNDVLGHQALYNILENLIRNVAKHGGAKKTVQFAIVISNCSDVGLYEVLVYDNIVKDDPELKTLENADCEELEACANSLRKNVCDVTAAEYQKHQLANKPGFEDCAKCVDKEKEIATVTEIEYQVYKINKHLNDSVIGSDSQLRKSAWGLIEMDVSAAYLRKISPNEVDNKEYNLVLGLRNCQGMVQDGVDKPPVNILKAVVTPHNSLGYRFHLLKPANFLLVGGYKTPRTDLTKFGIKTITMDALKESIEKGDTYPHEFLLTDVTLDGNLPKTGLPSREIIVDSVLKSGIEKALDLSVTDPLEEMNKLIWPLWVQSRLKEEKKKVKSLQLCGGLGVHSRPDAIESGALAGEKFEALFDNHGNKCSEWIAKWKEKPDYTFYEPLSSQGRGLVPTKAFSEYDRKNKLIRGYDPVLQSLVAEAVLFRVGVIDERIQSALTQDYQRIPFSELYPAANIHVLPSTKANLNASSFGDGVGSIKANIEEWLKDSLPRLDALIIHIGVLEKILPGSTEDNGDNIIYEYLKERIMRASPSVALVLTSGRGQPHNLPKDLRFVNFSSLMDCLVINRSKYVLTNLIYSARKLNKVAQ